MITERKTLKSEDFQAPLNIKPVDGVDLILTGKLFQSALNQKALLPINFNILPKDGLCHFKSF